MFRIIWPLLAKIFVVILLYFIFIQDGLYTAWQEYNRRNWILVEGKILGVMLTEKQNMGSKKYVSSFLNYSYILEGMEYKKLESIEWNKIYSTNYSLEEITVTEKEKYPTGKTIKVLVNPENKQESTSQSISGGYFYALLFSLAAEAWLLISIIKSLKKDKSVKVKTPL